jgi:hypothetical protein
MKRMLSEEDSSIENRKLETLENRFQGLGVKSWVSIHGNQIKKRRCGFLKTFLKLAKSARL